MKRILFLCVENSCRSQIAEGFARKLADKRVEVYSAGSKPSGEINPMAVQVMAEIGIDISERDSKSVLDLPVRDFDYLITLGCKDSCPIAQAKEHIEWKIEDPKGRGMEFFRKVRDDIEFRVKELLCKISAEN